MRRNHLEHHGEHDGQDKPRADALHRTAGERYRKRGGNRTRNRADEEGAEREQGELAGGEPFHEQARERQNHADYEHIAHHEPLRDGHVDAESEGKLGQGDIERGLAVHACEATAVESHEGKIRMHHLDTGAGKFGIARSHCFNCSFLSGILVKRQRRHKKMAATCSLRPPLHIVCSVSLRLLTTSS